MNGCCSITRLCRTLARLPVRWSERVAETRVDTRRKELARFASYEIDKLRGERVPDPSAKGRVTLP
jgi:hypothetical protein